jgi:hypothetical protein
MVSWLRIGRNVGRDRHYRARHRLEIGCSKLRERPRCGGVAGCGEHGIRHVE